MWIWRLVISDHLKIASPMHLDACMTYSDCEQAHLVLDAIENALAQD